MHKIRQTLLKLLNILLIRRERYYPIILRWKKKILYIYIWKAFVFLQY